MVELGVCGDSPGESDVGAFGCDGVDDFMFNCVIHAGYRGVDLSKCFADFLFWCPVVWA